MTNGSYGSRSHVGHSLDRDDKIRDGIFLDTPNRRGSGHCICSSSISDRYHGHPPYHPYRMDDRGCFLDEFKKAKPPKFDGEMKKPEHVDMWVIVMKKFFELHDYTENIKDRITIFSLKGRASIWISSK